VVRQTRGYKRRVCWHFYAWGSAQSSEISHISDYTQDTYPSVAVVKGSCRWGFYRAIKIIDADVGRHLSEPLNNLIQYAYDIGGIR
jgi:hypothetical protein